VATRIIGQANAPIPQVARVKVDEGAAGQRLDNFLIKHLKGVPKTHVYRLVRTGEVRVNMKRAQAQTKLALGDEVRLPPVRLAARATLLGGPSTDVAGSAPSLAPPRDFDVLFEDDHVLALDKPAGVAVHGGSGVAFGVIEQLRRARPHARFLELVHRLDKETSGVLLVAKKRAALTALQDQFRKRQTLKVYAALVFGAWPENLKVIDVPLRKTLDARGERIVRAALQERLEAGEAADGAKRSITLVQVAQRLPGYTLLDVSIKTGRTHQIRVHLTHAGAPIVGDPKYGDFERNRALARHAALRFDRMFLHAKRLAFDHPSSGERIALEAPLPVPCTTLLLALQQPRVAPPLPSDS
jgi:23S rRNA pseudouridine955/2504/2580 synthase